jgi:hypothetical protein
MKKDFDGAGWAKSHDTEFQRLIANARKKRDLSQPPQESKKNAEGIGTKQATEGHAVTGQNLAEPMVSLDPTDREFNVLGEEVKRQDTVQETARMGASLIEGNKKMPHGPTHRDTTSYKDLGHKANSRGN